MTSRGKWLVAGAGALVVAWSVAQLFLTHRLATAFHDRSVTDCARFVRERVGAHCQPLAPVTAGDWLPYAMTSVLVLLALATVAALLVRGGHRRWSALVVALPAANLFTNGHEVSRLLGAGWVQLSDRQLTTWLVTGAIVDTLVVAAIAVALTFALKPLDVPPFSSRHLMRSAPPMLVIAGWWLMRHPLPQTVDEVWLLQALAFVLAAALLANCALRPSTRAVAVLMVLPLCSLPVFSEASGFGSVLGLLLHHAAYAGGTAVAVLGLPLLATALRVRSTEPTATPAG